MNLPNKLTLGRVACTLVMIAFLLLPGKVFAWLSFVMFGLASLTRRTGISPAPGTW